MCVCALVGLKADKAAVRIPVEEYPVEWQGLKGLIKSSLSCDKVLSLFLLDHKFSKYLIR